MKICVGHPRELFALAKAMIETGQCPDFITVDGSEGGTGAAPLEFSDHVGMPLHDALPLVHATLVGIGMRDRVRIGASGKVTSAFDIVHAMALGADWCNAGRGFMFSLGCIQARSCHTDRCPTGITTQNPSLHRGIVVSDKGQKVYSYHQQTLEALGELVAAAGVENTSQITADHILCRDRSGKVVPLSQTTVRLDRGSLLGEGLARHELPEPFKSNWDASSADRFN
jgi:glutamate synthase domain-containing protein 2